MRKYIINLFLTSTMPGGLTENFFFRLAFENVIYLGDVSNGKSAVEESMYGDNLFLFPQSYFTDFSFKNGFPFVFSFTCRVLSYLEICGIQNLNCEKVSVFGITLIRIFPHLLLIRRDTGCGKIRTKITSNTDTF